MSDYLRRFPTGGYAKTIEEAQEEWRKLHLKAEAFFPGYQVTGWDPWIELAPKDRYTKGLDTQYIRLSVTSVLALRSPSAEDYWWTAFADFWSRLGGNYRLDEREKVITVEP